MAKTKNSGRMKFRCAAGFACKAPDHADLDRSSHHCYGCGVKVHSALWCGKRLDTLLNEQPYLVGRTLPGGRVLHDMGADNEMHCVCFTCIGKLPAGYDENSNNEGKGTLRNTDSEEESSSDEGKGEVGGPPAGGKQLNRGKVLPRRNTSSEDDKDSDEGEGEVGGPPGGNQLNAATGKQLSRGKVLPLLRNTEEEEEEEEEEEDSPQINQTREIGKEDIEFPIALVPMLQLHAPIPNTDGQDEGTLHFCDFNCRKVSMSRMNCIDPSDNMVKRLRREKYNSLPSVADGRIVVVVTSFINIGVGHRDSLMKSVAFPEEKAKCHAIPLTTNILQTAISFLEGRKEEEEEEEEEEEDEEEDKEEKEEEEEKEDEEEDEEEDEDEDKEDEEEKESGNQVIEDFKQVMDKFRVYLQLLVEKMQKIKGFDDLKAFINDRDWPDGSWGFGRCKELLESQGSVTVDDAYFLRRFIHENLARATKIVMHVVDGIH